MLSSLASCAAVEGTTLALQERALNTCTPPSPSTSTIGAKRVLGGGPRNPLDARSFGQAAGTAPKAAQALPHGQSEDQLPEMMRKFQIVVAVGEDWSMGLSGRMPWEAAGQRLPGDLSRFKSITSAVERDGDAGKASGDAVQAKRRNAVIMGRLTYESIPAKYRPLPGRLNIILSRSAQQQEGGLELEGGPAKTDLLRCSSLASALQLLGSKEWKDHIARVFVVGGAQIYREAILSPLCEAVHVTTVHRNFPADIFFPHPEELQRSFRVWCSTPRQLDNGTATSFTCFVRSPAAAASQVQEGEKNSVSRTGNENGNGNGDADATALALPVAVRELHEEYQYLNMVRDIIYLGAAKGDRTGTGTLSMFGTQMRFNLRNSFPLLTTKRVFWRGVVEELLWFISGSTNANLLKEKGVNIWDGNGSRQFLDSLGFTEREEGDLGPVYGFQWRHFGAEYKDMHSDYRGEGVDQLAEVVHKLKHKPEDRRIILSAWNPAALHEMSLPPCHLLAQFYVANGELTCQMYQRSCDMGLGVPFNIASYALLTCMLAHVCGLRPGDFVHTLGDAHVYNNHIAPLKEQLKNLPRAFPVLNIKREVKEIDGFSSSDFELVGYKPHKKIAMDMAV